jgi:hypothetical protein
MPQTITDPTDPNWGLSPAAASPATATGTRRGPTPPALVDDPSDPNWGLERPPDFRVANEPPSPSLWEQASSSVGTFLKEAGSVLNPITAAQGLVSAAMHPIEAVKGAGAAQEEVFRKAQDAYQRGDYIGAATDFLYYLLPVAGPELSKRGHQIREGEVAKGLGGTVGFAGAMVAPELVKQVPPIRVGRPVFKAQLNPAEAAAVEYAKAEGVPLDVATATGSRAARAMQKRVASSMGGEGTASRVIEQQADALKALSEKLTAEAAPGVATPETAGAGVRSGVSSIVKELHAKANEAYTQLREIEARPESATKMQTAAEGSPAYTKLQQKIAAGADDGQPLTRGEIATLRQMEAELDAMPFSRRLLQPTKHGGSLEHVPGTGGAGTPLYDEILQRAPGTAEMTRAEVQHSIRKLLEQGEWTNAARGAVKLAREGTYRGPSLPADWPALGTTTRMQLPIDLSEVKASIAPIYAQLQREGELAPLMGGKAQALRALDRVLSGPDQVPLSVAEAALGDLKTLARTDLPQLRTQGQGIAAKAVRELDQTIQLHAAGAGDEVFNLLKEGRAATATKHRVGELLKKFKPMEDVAIARRLTAPQDSQIGLLRKVRDAAPAKIPDVGRAYLHNLFDLATAEGGFGQAAKLQAEWRKLGPETKTILFPDAKLRIDLDHFFLLAKRVAENPNPSGTAHTLTALNLTSQPLTWVLAKMLYTRRGVQTLSQSFFLDLSPQRASGAARTVAIANLLKAAKEAGVEAAPSQ